MNQEFKFFKTTMPQTRKAVYYLGCIHSSIFIDFNRMGNNPLAIKDATDDNKV